MSVTKAIFPVAGLGTRFLPATKAQPKEMLPVVDKPLIQYAVEEAYAAGIREMIFVTGRHKRAIEDHFDTAYELEIGAREVGQAGAARRSCARSCPTDMDCIYVRQAQPLGLGHAVLCAQPPGRQRAVRGAAGRRPDDRPTAAPVLAQMVDEFDERAASMFAVQEVPAEHTRRYGIVGGTPVGDARWSRSSAWSRSRRPKTRRRAWASPAATS